MTKIKLLLAAAVLAMAGCVDTIESVTRQYRNLNNEALDALMTVTDDASAKSVKTRFLEPLMKRYAAIDETVEKTIKNNRTRRDMMKEVYESQGFWTYVGEFDRLLTRYNQERNRIKKIYDRLYEQKNGVAPKDIDDPNVAPALYLLLMQDLKWNKLPTEFSALEVQFGGGIKPPTPPGKQKEPGDMPPKLIEIMDSFKDWKVKEYEQMRDKCLKDMEIFVTSPGPTMVNVRLILQQPRSQ